MSPILYVFVILCVHILVNFLSYFKVSIVTRFGCVLIIKNVPITLFFFISLSPCQRTGQKGTMHERSYTLPLTADYPLSIIAKRYWIPEFEANVENPAAQTLIVLHSTSFHKEAWEPCLQELFKLISQSNTTTNLLIRDVWAIDCPNHGESGALNNQALKDPQFTNCVWLFGSRLQVLLLNSVFGKFLVRAMHTLCTGFFHLDQRLVLIFEDGI